MPAVDFFLKVSLSKIQGKVCIAPVNQSIPEILNLLNI